MKPKFITVAAYLVIAILVLLPFHALLTTWFGSNLGHLDLIRIWKELLMVPLGLYTAWLLWRDKPLAEQWSKSWLIWLVIGYTLWFIGYAALVIARGSVTPSAVIYSLLSNLRYIWFMLMVWIVAHNTAILRRHWEAIVLWPASIVLGFGLLQRILLPADFLRHFGYGPNTIPATETVNQQTSLRRVQSTLRGANPLGTYLIVVITTIVSYIRKSWLMAGLLLLALGVLFATYSRSAWIGTLVAVASLLWLRLLPRLNRGQRQLLIGATIVFTVAALGLVWLARNNSNIQNLVLHTNQQSRTLSSNEVRATALRGGWRDVTHEPMGRGPGTAGPASARNTIGGARIAENYYLQIGQEVGLIGLVLFLAINAVVAVRLYRHRSAMATVLLASFIGLTMVNLVSHAWADDTIALLWWGLAGICLGSSVIIRARSNDLGQKRRQTKKTKNP